MKRKIVRKILVLSMVLSLVSILFSMNVFATDAVTTDTATKDVFLNTDSESGYSATELSNAVESEYTRLGGTASDLRIATNSTEINTTDLSSWYVYDHYDTAYWGTPAAWQTAMKLSSLTDPKRPYQSYSESSGSVTSLKTWIDNNSSLSSTQKFDQHIYSGINANGAFMTFVGYGSPAYTDYLFYPDTLAGTKTVTYTIDSANVNTHTLTSAGFLINTGIDGSGNIKGYILYYKYSAPTAYTLSLYPIKDNVKATDLAAGLGVGVWDMVTYLPSTVSSVFCDAAVGGAVTGSLTTSTITDVVLTITPTSVKVEQKASGTGDPTFSETWSLTPTGFNGFGPYVEYSSHGCSQLTSYKFSNLKMSSATAATASVSALAALRNSDYLIRPGVHKYFVNILGASSSYDLTKDANYLSLVQNKSIDLFTNKSVSAISAQLPAYYVDTSNTTLSTLATSIANYLLGINSGTTDSDPEPPVLADIVANFSLFSEGIQVTNIMHELIPAEGVSIDVVNATQAPSGVTLGTPTYKLTSPSGAETTLAAIPFTVTNNDSNWPAGRYKVTMDYGGTSIPAEANFYILADTTVPSVVAVKNGNAIDFTFTNTASPAGNTYTSNLVSYVIENTSTTATPTSTWANQVAIVNNATSATEPITQAGYMHILVKDEAGNIGHTSIEITQIFPTITAPVAANIYYGQALSDSALTGGVATYSGNPVAGSFAWVTPTVKPGLGATSHQVRFTPTSSTYATITMNVSVTVEKRALNISTFSANSKTYDASTVATADPDTWITDAINGDVPKFTYTAAFDTATNGTNKVVSFSNLALTADAVNANYTLVTTTGSTTANISKRPLTITLQDKQKVYGQLDPVFTVTYNSSADGGMGFAGTENANTLGYVVLYRLSGNDVGSIPSVSKFSMKPFTIMSSRL